MDNNSISCPWGDCPGLNHGQKSREHEGRFINWSKAERQTADNSGEKSINGASRRNPEGLCDAKRYT
ncbi:MAG: hypothetical protein GX847_12585 [Clostridiales bacterium]|nr:hypothetical protein [Clostridiales bacterium]